MGLFIKAWLVIVTLSGTACSDSDSTNDSQESQINQQVADTSASEPIQVGGAFLVSCGLDAADDQSFVGCNGNQFDLGSAESRAFLISTEQAVILNEGPRTDSWQASYWLPDNADTQGFFRLDLIGEDGDAAGIYMESLETLAGSSSLSGISQ
ncbi:hypothetical protein [Pseudobacteriovorax antillogorgiicola]|uniref:Lipoprotein n=1 Tax=Pseudobacteriovorax antillogorgiicola TaxID=1513793 RepID=A0A1Y6CWU1_9BACT|nr:hypothetical protein [Pseudobacteriovorax antillogorgiicola]TCS42729.1 hypothetical protein EDD56_14116 [Pseudobacteriovorax antillogorgiicola]SMF82396.1 hypothetical protein SAMN06296036_1414 [Pseudobacteriovorax antillogorgiicola]